MSHDVLPIHIILILKVLEVRLLSLVGIATAAGILSFDVLGARLTYVIVPYQLLFAHYISLAQLAYIVYFVVDEWFTLWL